MSFENERQWVVVITENVGVLCQTYYVGPFDQRQKAEDFMTIWRPEVHDIKMREMSTITKFHATRKGPRRGNR